MWNGERGGNRLECSERRRGRRLVSARSRISLMLALTIFATTILEDDELILDESDVHSLRERFPGLMSLHETVSKA